MISNTGENYDIHDLMGIEYVEVPRNVTVEVVRNVTQYEFVCEPYPIFVEMPITRNVTVEVVRNVTVEVVRNVTQYEFVCVPYPIFVEVPITRNVTEFIVHEGPTYTEYVTEYIPWPFFMPVPFVQNVTQNVTQFEEVPIYICNVTPVEYVTVEVEVVRNEYVTVEVEVVRNVNNTDVCLRHLWVVFLETSTAHMHILVALGGFVVTAVISFVWACIRPFTITPLNRWNRDVFGPAFSWISTTFVASVGGLGGVCISCWWEKWTKFAASLYANLYASYAPWCYVGAVLFLGALIFALYKIINWGLQMLKQREVDNQFQKLMPVLELMVHSQRKQWAADRAIWETLKGDDCRANPVVKAFQAYLDAKSWSQTMEEDMKVLVEFMQSCNKLYKNPLARAWFKIYWINLSASLSGKKQILMDPQISCATYNALNMQAQELNKASNDLWINQPTVAEGAARAGITANGAAPPAAQAGAQAGANAGANAGADPGKTGKLLLRREAGVVNSVGKLAAEAKSRMNREIGPGAK